MLNIYIHIYIFTANVYTCIHLKKKSIVNFSCCSSSARPISCTASTLATSVALVTAPPLPPLHPLGTLFQIFPINFLIIAELVTSFAYQFPHHPGTSQKLPALSQLSTPDLSSLPQLPPPYIKSHLLYIFNQN